MEPKGPDYVQKDKKKKATKANNFDEQFPELVRELEDMTAEPNVPPEALKTVAEMKKERYAKFLEANNRQEELERQERTKALDCMMKIMDH